MGDLPCCFPLSLVILFCLALLPPLSLILLLPTLSIISLLLFSCLPRMCFVGYLSITIYIFAFRLAPRYHHNVPPFRLSCVSLIHQFMVLNVCSNSLSGFSAFSPLYLLPHKLTQTTRLVHSFYLRVPLLDSIYPPLFYNGNFPDFLLLARLLFVLSLLIQLVLSSGYAALPTWARRVG